MMKFSSLFSSLLAGVFCNFLNVDLSIAQVTSDRTTATQVRRDQDTFNITGGTTAGRNLFHSFREFSVPRNAIAHFQNADTIQNIFGRVTGASASRINGIIRANGVANLFLLNPNGVICGGLHAYGGRIEVGAVGASGRVGLETADAIWRLQFPADLERADVTFEDANIEVAAAGQGDITIHAHNLDFLDSFVNAGIDVGDSLTNQAGDVILDATGHLNLGQDSRVENDVDAIGNSGNILIRSDTLALTAGSQISASVFGQGKAGDVDIVVRDRVSIDGFDQEGFSSGIFSTVETSEARGNSGTIRLSANSLDVTNNGTFDTSMNGRGRAGSIIINVKNRAFFDNSGDIFSTLGEEAVGRGGNIILTVGDLSLLRGGQLLSLTRGQGNAGDIQISARDRIVINGFDREGFPSGIFSSVEPEAQGDGGDITLSSSSLSVTNDASLDVSVLGEGKAGNISVNVTGNVVFSNSIIFATLEEGAVGQGGNVILTVGSLSLVQGGQLLALTREQGDAGDIRIRVRDRLILDGVSPDGHISAIVTDVESTAVGNSGDITINTNSLVILNGAELTASTSGQGNAGNITIQARDQILLQGNSTRARDQFPLTVISNSINSSVDRNAQGDSGTIVLTTDRLSIEDGAGVFVVNLEEGRAGDIRVNAETVLIDRASIAATTASGDGGSISLDDVNVLNLRRGSRISATAGEAEASGDGGNITINGNFLVANPSGNSDITANAFEGAGGRITITAEGIVGLVSRSREDLQALLGTTNPAQLNPQQLPTSDITAISQTNPNLSGQVTLNAPDINPEQGITSLPNTLIDTTQQINPACSARAGFFDQNQFVVTGRGGLPAAPTDTLSEAGVSVDLGQSIATTSTATPHLSSGQTDTRVRLPSQPIIEAQGWRVDEQGNIILTAEDAIASQRSPVLPNPCSSPYSALPTGTLRINDETIKLTAIAL
jgi:filamentous hemagglutinin family protein